MRGTVLTREDRAIFDRLPLRAEADYRYADAIDARSIQRWLLPISGSIVESVAAEQMAAGR